MSKFNELMNLFDRKRREWDPTEPARAAVRAWDSVEGIEIHWTGAAGPSSLSFEDKKRWALGIERYHEGTKGWSDLFYQAFVFADGEAWEGRAPLAYSQSDTKTWLTVHVPGTYGLELTKVQKDKLVALAATTSGRKMRGHNDRSATACPGPAASAFIDEYNAGRYPAAAAPAPVGVVAAVSDAEVLEALRTIVRWGNS